METQATGRINRQTSHAFHKKLLALTVSGGAAFWIVDFAISISPIAAEYRSAFSISYLPLALVEALVGGMFIAAVVSYSLLRFFDKIPVKNPILKALILSFLVMPIIEVLSTVVNSSNVIVYLFVDSVMNVPRFLALGVAIGYAYNSLGESAKNEISVSPFL